MKNKNITSNNFMYMFITLYYLEGDKEIDYNILKEYMSINYNDFNYFIDEIDYFLDKMVKENIILKDDDKIIINNLLPRDIIYTIKVNKNNFDEMIKFINGFLIYEYNNKKLVKKKTV